MNVSCSRFFVTQSGKKLRRARRLYFRVAFEFCWNGGYPAIRLMADKAKKAGLFSPVTSDKSVRWSVISHMYKEYRKANPGQFEGSWAWHDFRKAFPWLRVEP